MKIKEVPSLSLGARNRKNPKRSGRPVPKARKCSWTAGQLNSSVSGELCWIGEGLPERTFTDYRGDLKIQSILL